LNTELRNLEVEVNSFGFGNDFAEAEMRKIMEGCPGGRVKWITDTDTLLGEFYHIGEVARNIVAIDAELELTFSPNVTPGDAFRFEPGKYRFDAIDDRSKRFYTRVGPLEKQRVYTYAFEARVYPSQNQSEQIAIAKLQYIVDGKKEVVTHDIVANRTLEREQLERVDKGVETLFLVLEEFRTTDPETLLSSLQAQLNILQGEGRYPAQIKLLETVIEKLARERTISVISEEEKRQLRSDDPSQIATRGEIEREEERQRNFWSNMPQDEFFPDDI
jgi:hypothetical protein